MVSLCEHVRLRHSSFADILIRRSPEGNAYFAKPSDPGRAASFVIRPDERRMLCLRRTSRTNGFGSLPWSSPETILDQPSVTRPGLRS